MALRNLLIIAVSVLAVFTLLISAYLTPNDMAGCQTKPSSKPNCEVADVIVAISGGNTPVRTAEAIRLYQSGWAPKLMFAGAAKDTSGPSNAEAMKEQAVRAGVPENVITTEEFSHTTKENAELTKRLLVSTGGGQIKRIILVTSAYHQRRAGLEFREQVGQLITIVNHPAPDDPDWPILWWLTPSSLR
jgi:uncharacterized SAM-binding protein YcdF (DUF218 family)